MKKLIKKILLPVLALSSITCLTSCDDSATIHVDLDWHLYNFTTQEELQTRDLVYGNKYKIDFTLSFDSKDIKHNDVASRIKLYLGAFDSEENFRNLTTKPENDGIPWEKDQSTPNSNAYVADFNLPKGTGKFDGFQNSYITINVNSLKDFESTSVTIELMGIQNDSSRTFMFNRVSNKYVFDLTGKKADPIFTQNDNLIKLSGVSYKKDDYQLNFPSGSDSVELSVFRDSGLTVKAGQQTISKDSSTDVSKIINLRDIAKEFVGSSYFEEQISKGPFEMYYKFEVGSNMNYNGASFVAKIVFE